MAQIKYQPVPWPAPHQIIPDYGRVEVRGVAAGSDGRVYVFQYSQTHPMLVFEARTGRFLRAWGAGLFTMPHGCRVAPDGSLWLTDDGDSRVLRFTTEGELLGTWGVKNRPGNDAAHFNRPADVAFAPSGDVYIADGYGNARVVRLSRTGRFLGAWGRHGTEPGEFHLVHSVAVDKTGRVFVADRENARIQIFTPGGKFLTEWKQVGHPFGLAFTPQGHLAVCDGVADTVSLYDAQGKRLARWGGTGNAPGKFRRAHLLSVDQTSAIYVAEVKGKRVQKFVPNSSIL